MQLNIINLKEIFWLFLIVSPYKMSKDKIIRK